MNKQNFVLPDARPHLQRGYNVSGICNASAIRKAFLFALLFLISPILSHSQTLTDTTEKKKEVEILNSDYLKMQEINGKKVTRLIGNVALKQDDVLMWCDSATLEKETNSVDAWGNVHIKQDTVNAFSQTLHHDGNKKLSELHGNVRLYDGKMRLFTEVLFYDVKNRLSYYLTGGKVLKDSTIILSQKGYYYSKISDAYFHGDVKITDPNYSLTSDTLKYNTDSKTSIFYGNTVIYNKDSRIYCDNGWYNSTKDISSFGKNTVVVNPPQRIVADSLYYERFRGYGKAIDDFKWTDSSMETEIQGCTGEFFDKNSYIMATDKPLLIYKMDKDSLFLTADTLKSMHRKEGDTIRHFFAYHHVKMFTKDMQGVCDSLFYGFEDSTFRMYYNPVIWSDNIQMSGDTIFLLTKNKKVDRLDIYHSGFIISPSGKKFFDQVKGNNILGYFIDNELKRLDVIGSAESLYFGKNDAGKFIGINKVVSANISMYFKEKKMDKIVFLKNPDAVFTPMKMTAAEMFRLKDYNWQIDKKPKNRQAILE